MKHHDIIKQIRQHVRGKVAVPDNPNLADGVLSDQG
jgi:hypothetical protein